MDKLSDTTKHTLELARHVYGYNNQILVAVEELCELASVCAKYPRYTDSDKAVEELREHVLDECADVVNVLDHIQAIFGIDDNAVFARADLKALRVARWLEESSAIEQSLKDREVVKEACSGDCNTCFWWDHPEDPWCPCTVGIKSKE